MSKFQIVNSINEIDLSNRWVESTKFNNKDKVVKHDGRHYRLIAKMERSFTCAERIGRVFLGVLAVIFSLGSALFSKSIRNLMAENKVKLRFGITYVPRQVTAGNIQSLVIDTTCTTSSPCHHVCKVTFTDNLVEQHSLDGVEIKNVIQAAPDKVIYAGSNAHFLRQTYFTAPTFDRSHA